MSTAVAAAAQPSKGLEGIVAANTRLSDVKGEIGEGAANDLPDLVSCATRSATPVDFE